VEYKCLPGFLSNDAVLLLYIAITIMCPPVPTVDNAVADTAEALEGTMVTYTCDDGYFFADGNITTTTTCEDGNWTLLEESSCECEYCKQNRCIK